MAFIHEEGKKVAKCKHCHMSFTTSWISSKRPHVYIPLCFSKINTITFGHRCEGVRLFIVHMNSSSMMQFI